MNINNAKLEDMIKIALHAAERVTHDLDNPGAPGNGAMPDSIVGARTQILQGLLIRDGLMELDSSLGDIGPALEKLGNLSDIDVSSIANSIDTLATEIRNHD